jgi:putative N6-adenine-specific DNA methylase
MESYSIFIIVLPGLEDLAAREIALKLPLEKFNIIKGGIEAQVSLEWIEKAHLRLKIPTRILLRVANFKVRDFPKLYHKFAHFNWKPFLSHPEPEWEISCSKSRLNHTGRIEETIKKAMAEVLIKQPLKKDWEKKNYPPQTFYVRLVDDTLFLSLDLSGEPLYKRGLQKIKGVAPLRENLASAFLFEITKDLSESYSLVDPMCGSGTFLTEGKTFFDSLHLRPFAFETAPFYKGKILKDREPDARTLPFNNYYGFDKNLELITKVNQEIALGLELQELDSLREKLPVTEDSILICNPPYGERIEIEGKRGHFLKVARDKFLETDKPFRMGWLIPTDMDDIFQKAPGYKTISKIHIRNGGLPVTFWVWERN